MSRGLRIVVLRHWRWWWCLISHLDRPHTSMLAHIACHNIGVTTSSTLHWPAWACSDAANLQTEAQPLLSLWVKSTDMIESQIEFGNPIWLRSFVNRIGQSVGNLHKDTQGIESTSRIRKTIWPRNRVEAWTTCNTMGYQIRDRQWIKQFFLAWHKSRITRKSPWLDLCMLQDIPQKAPDFPVWTTCT